jgi:hypothetical protein
MALAALLVALSHIAVAEPPMTEDRAIATIVRLGGSISANKDREIDYVYLTDAELPADLVEALSRFQSLEHLDVW